MKTATQKDLNSHRSSSNLWISLRYILRELAPILIPSVLFSICIYCCIMENLTFTPSQSLRQSPIKTKKISGQDRPASLPNDTYIISR
ncbi:MAG: hypothetical protein K2I87_04210 [Bacteroidales bacterium]|nr:hypothetical protein [Bacteroidales bacterium]